MKIIHIFDIIFINIISINFNSGGFMSKILLVDDDIEVLNINKVFLEQEGFTVFVSDDPDKALAITKNKKPDCIVLDVMLPKMDGFSLCKKIRTFCDAPIIFLSGKSSEDDKLTGLTCGAEDYIVKPYSVKELKARIDIMIKRHNPAPKKVADATTITYGNLSIDRLTHKAYYKDEDLQLSKREYQVLLYFASHPNTDLTFEDIGTELFGTYTETDRRSVMVNVSRLRKHFSGISELENMLETVWSVGYKFITKD